jgi:hypothetical protein
MKASRIAAVVVISLLVFMGLVWANEGQEKAKDNCTVTVNSDPFFSPQNTCELLGHTRDLWYDAALKGDDREVDRYYAEIERILDRDIKAGRVLIKLLVQQSTVKEASSGPVGENLVDEKILGGLPKADRQLVRELYSILTAKESLVKSVGDTGAFSNKYRLLGDYIQLLRKELDMPRLQYALDKVK